MYGILVNEPREGHLVPSPRFAIAFLVLLGIATEAFAQPPDEYCATEFDACQSRPTWKQRWNAYWHEFEMHRFRVNHWPDPFLLPDRELVREPLRQMADNGWKEQNTFSEQLFADGGADLNYAGHEKLRLTLTQMPPHRRVIFVLEGRNPEITAARVAAVYRHMAEIAPATQPYPVFTTAIVPRGMSGSMIDSVDRSFLLSQPQPRLPASAPTDASSVSGAAAP